MAEVAIPIVALGAMWLINNDKKKEERDNQESFDNVSAPNQRKLRSGYAKSYLPTKPDVNYPKQTYSELTSNSKYYPAPNAATDRYFQQSVYEKKVEDGEDPTNAGLFKSLSGSTVQKSDIKHNNMVPFFGSRVTQRSANNRNEGILDNLNGSGAQQFKKKAVAPLFKPQKNMHFAHGAPNVSDFIQSRIVQSRNISNSKPWEEVRVGPGLNKGFTSQGSNGFNAGMGARQEWLPRTVDQLRTKTNPKITFGLANHEGPAKITNTLRGVHGRIEKNRPDTFYLNSPDRWFTTTGQEKKQKVRSAQVMQPIRSNVGREYFGSGNGNQDGGSLAGPAEQQYRKSRRPVLAPFGKYPGAAHNQNYKAGGDATKDDYGKDGYRSLPNSRSTTRQADDFGGVMGLARAITAPILDILRPSRKENVIGNLRPNGNASGTYGVNEARVWNPADRPKTTIKEQTIENVRPNGNVQGNYSVSDGGYLSAEHQPITNQRDSTTSSYTGDAGAAPGSTGPLDYTAYRNADINTNKEELLVAQGKYDNIGNMSLFNSAQNVSVGKFGSIQPSQLVPNMPKQSANLSTHGSMTGRNFGKNVEDCQRNNPDILNAFNNNPYTKSLHSVA